jgi:hypothetical protein
MKGSGSMIPSIAVLVVLGLLLRVFYQISHTPMYQVGNVRKGINMAEPLDPPEQMLQETYFQVSEAIKRHRFSRALF